MVSYRLWVHAHPFLSAAVQFGLLGTLGELGAASIQARRWSFPSSATQLLLKALAWALLGLVIKAGFVGMKGFTRALLDQHLLPAGFASGFRWSFTLSALTNLFFGPQMMLLHRLEDNLILGRRGFEGMGPAFRTLLWFWIPAHTLTFSLPPDYQIGLAALWSLALGFILGFASLRRGPEANAPTDPQLGCPHET